MRRIVRVMAILASASAILAGTADAQPAPRHYIVKPGTTCDGFPRLAIEMTDGMCAGLVYGPADDGPVSGRSIRLPRTLLALAGDRDWLVSDLGAWSPGQGAVWRLTVERGRPPAIAKVLGGLDMPHTLAVGPDGMVYLGEMGRISRFDPRAADPAASRQVVVSGLPDNRLHENRHPLSSFLFDADGALLVNVGAPSDQCLPPAGAPRPARCAEAEGAAAGGVVRRYAYLGQGRWSPQFTVFASGLRNSLALARSRAGVILQGENSIDVESRDQPFDELNVLSAGRNYGWPYCVDLDQPAPGWRGASALDCASPAHARPALLLPPHAAPLALAYYDGAMFPRLRNRVLVTLHGYRSVGARIAAYAVDPQGAPLPTERPRYATYQGQGIAWRAFPARVAGAAAGPLLLTRNWDAKPNERPRGWPVGLAVAADGAIWVADDRNGAVIRLAIDRP